MPDKINEFALTLPITTVAPIVAGHSVSSAEVAPPAEPQPETEVEQKFSTDISIYPDTISLVNMSGNDVTCDIVFTVNCFCPEVGTKIHRVVKRICLDKEKLYNEAIATTPVRVEGIEEDAAEVLAEMMAFRTAKRMREMAGIAEPAGDKTFTVKFSHKANDNATRVVESVQLSSMRDKAHARHVFTERHATTMSDVKIVKIEEVK